MAWGYLKRPGKARRATEQLLVEVVADAPDRLREEDPGRDRLGKARDVHPATAQEDDASERPAGDTAPDAESSLPEGKPAPPVVRHLVPARHVVVEARTEDAGGH